MKTVISIIITHRKPIPDLLDFVSGRAYTLDGVTDVSASLILEVQDPPRIESSLLLDLPVLDVPPPAHSADVIELRRKEGVHP